VGNKNRTAALITLTPALKNMMTEHRKILSGLMMMDAIVNKYKDPDISYITTPSRLIISPHTKELVTPTANDVAELLAIPFNGKSWYSLIFLQNS